MSSTLRLLAALTAFSALCPPAAAQQPSNWTTLSLPAGASASNSIGTTVTFRTPTDIWLYSGITKRWTVVPASAAATLFQANDYCIIREGRTIHGYASHTGVVDTIETATSAVVVSGPASSAWVTLVRDGHHLYGFGAFAGEWTSTTIASTNPTMVANRLIGLVDDGHDVLALSAHHGRFMRAHGGAGVTLTVVGEAEVGTAHSATVFRAFSAQQNRWVVANVPSTATQLQQNEYALVWSGNQIWGCSGLTGTLATYTASAPIAGVGGVEGVASFLDGGQLVCFGSGRGTFVTLPVTNPTVAYDYHFALVQDIGVLTPFSAVLGAFGPPLAGTFASQSNDAIAYANDGTTAYAYSPLRNTWTQASIAAASPWLVRDSVIVPTAGGYEALSARHGTWVSLTTTTPGSVQAPSTGSTFVANENNGATLHVFDARLNRWATAVGQGPMTTKISRHTLMAHDGLSGFGFGQPSGEWFVEPLTAAPSVFDTASSIGTLRHGNLLSVYSVQASFTYTGRYPEFTQAINLGNTLTLHQLAPADSLLVQLFGSDPAYLSVPPFGTLYIEPSGLGWNVWPRLVDADGYLEMRIAIPNQPSLVGAQLHLQNLVVPATGQLWLSSSVAPILF